MLIFLPFPHAQNEMIDFLKNIFLKIWYFKLDYRIAVFLFASGMLSFLYFSWDYFIDRKPPENQNMVAFSFILVSIGINYILEYHNDQAKKNPDYYILNSSFENKYVFPLMKVFIFIGIFLFIPSIILSLDGDYINIDFLATEISDKNEYIELQKVKKKFIKIDSKDKECESYKIRITEKNIFHEQPFESMKYTRNKSNFELMDKESWNSVCWQLSNINQELPLSFITENIEEKEGIKILQTLFADMKNKVSDISIFVKGYADDEDQKWSRNLSKDNKYNDIDYYMADDDFKTSYTIADKRISTHQIKNQKNGEDSYTNKDLPFLRAKYVLDNYFDKFLKGCIDDKIKTGILEGVVLDKKSPEIRGTEVYVTLCGNKPHYGCSQK